MSAVRVPDPAPVDKPPSPAPLSVVTSPSASSAGKPKLFDPLREALRSRHYSRRTESTYIHGPGALSIFIMYAPQRTWPNLKSMLF